VEGFVSSRIEPLGETLENQAENSRKQKRNKPQPPEPPEEESQAPEISAVPEPEDTHQIDELA
jgi:hypothetical protein